MKQRVANYSFVILALLTACTTDGAYDKLLESDGIDMTMQLGRDFTLPLGSSDKIYITELLDTADVQQLHIDDAGVFYLSQEGVLNNTSVHVRDVSLEVHPSIRSLDFELDVDQSRLPQQVIEALPYLEVGQDLSAYPSLTVCLSRDDINFDQQSEFRMSRTGIDDALLSVSRVLFKEPGTVKCSIVFTNLPGQRKRISSSAFHVNMPDFLLVRNEVAPGQYNLPDRQWADFDSSTLTWSESFVVEGLDFARTAEGPLKVTNGIIDCEGALNLIGRFSISDLEVTGSDLCVKLNAQGQKCISLSKPISVLISPEVSLPTFDFGELTGTFDNAIDPLSTHFDIELGDELSFLQEGSANIDLIDPVVYIYLNNPSPARMLADYVITASNGKEVRYLGVDCSDPSGHKTVVLNSDNIRPGDDLHTFLSPLPKSLDVVAYPYVDRDHAYTLTMGADYVVNGTFDVRVPLSFRQVDFTYDRHIENLWGESSEITERVETISMAELKVTISNSIPLDLELTVTGTNTAGKEDASVIDCMVDKSIKAGKLGAAVSTEVTACLTIPSTKKLKDLILRIKGKGTNCELNARQCFEITKASLRLPEGVNVDLN